MAQRLKRLPPMRETRARSLGREDPLEKEMATHSSILAWRIPWTEEPAGLYSPQGCKELDTTERLHFHFIHSKTIPQPTILIVLTDWLKLLSSVESSGG